MVTYDALIRYAKKLEGEPLETSARHKRFTVQVAENGLVYTPESGKPRLNNKSTIEKVLERFNESKSYRPSDYEMTRNPSYLMRLLELMTSEDTHK